MRKMWLALILVLVMAVPAFAQITNVATGLAATIKDNNQNQNTNLNTDVNTNLNTNINTFVPVNTNIQGQQQGQLQGQMQGQGQLQGQVNVNDQVIAPEQKVIFKSPTQLMPAPSQGLPELNFGNGRMKDVTKGPYKFALFGIQEYNGEPIREVLYTDANVKIKNYFQAVLDAGKKVSSMGNFKSNETKIIVIEAEAQKTWTLGANVVGAGSGLATSGMSGGSGTGGLGPQWGGTKADDLRNIFIVKVAIPAQVLLYEKKPEIKKDAPKKSDAIPVAPSKKTVFGKEVSE